MKSYVYAHILPDTGSVIYIGSGQQERAWSLYKRSDPHQSILNNIQRGGFSPADYVVILNSGLTVKQARDIEYSLIHIMSPPLNQHGAGVANAGRGEFNKNSVMDTALVHELRDLYSMGNHSMRAISRMYGLGVSSTRKAIQGKSWSHLN